MDPSETQKKGDRQHNKELRGRLRDLHREELSKTVLTSITEIWFCFKMSPVGESEAW